MAATAKQPQVQKLDYNIDKSTYDQFVKMCSKKGYAPKVIVEKLISKYNETGQF